MEGYVPPFTAVKNEEQVTTGGIVGTSYNTFLEKCFYGDGCVGDGYNDIYKVKEGYQSIVSFKAVIFNRWGQKLYAWDTLDGGWDGKFHGKTVKDGVYFVVVNARGADGKEYKIRKDVNVLTGYSGTGTNGND